MKPTSATIYRCIARRMRRHGHGSVDKYAAIRDFLAGRLTHLVWHHVAVDQLLIAGIQRRRGDMGRGRIHVRAAREARLREAKENAA